MHVANLTKPLAVAALLVFGANGLAVAAEPVGPKLTQRLKELIASEMQQVSQATADLALAIASGDHDSAADLGAKIRDSFILKQSLTDQDKQDLMSAVPAGFVALDRRFHADAGKLAHAAEQKDSEIQGFYYARMIDACVQCHTQFAFDRFPGLGEASGEGHDH